MPMYKSKKIGVIGSIALDNIYNAESLPKKESVFLAIGLEAVLEAWQLIRLLKRLAIVQRYTY